MQMTWRWIDVFGVEMLNILSIRALNAYYFEQNGSLINTDAVLSSGHD